MELRRVVKGGSSLRNRGESWQPGADNSYDYRTGYKQTNSDGDILGFWYHLKANLVRNLGILLWSVSTANVNHHWNVLF